MRALYIQLPDDLANLVDSKVASGDFQSPSALMIESLADWFNFNDVTISDNISEWMIEDIQQSLGEYKNNPSTAVTADEVFKNIQAHHVMHKSKAD